jgi:hypothetical protein
MSTSPPLKESHPGAATTPKIKKCHPLIEDFKVRLQSAVSSIDRSYVRIEVIAGG